MNLKHAQYVLAVLRAGSMTEAAKQLYISQPSLSQTIRQAEEQLGTPIFNRDTSPMSLTYAGQMFVKAAREVMSIDTNLLNEIEEIKKESHGRMRLGFSVQRGMQLLPQVIPDFTQKYPYVRIELHEHGSDTLEQLLCEGVCDLALITTNAKRKELNYILLENEVIVLMADADTDIAKRLPDGATIDITEAAYEAFVTLRHGHSIRAIQDHLFQVNGMKPKVGDRVAYGTGPLGAYSQLHVLPAANVVKLPEDISFEQAAAVMLKGLTTQYLLRQTYELKGGETILFHAAAGGVGSIACQWAKALNVKLIGTVSSAEKAAHAKALGAWETIDYSHEDVAKRVLELTDGKKCPVVYDGVGKDTWLTSLDCVAPRGLMVSFGNASGAVTGVNLGILSQKGSLYVTRPTLASYANSAENLQAMADELFAMIRSGAIQVDISQRFALADAAKAQTELSARRTTGSTILLP